MIMKFHTVRPAVAEDSKGINKTGFIETSYLGARVEYNFVDLRACQPAAVDLVIPGQIFEGPDLDDLIAFLQYAKARLAESA